MIIYLTDGLRSKIQKLTGFQIDASGIGDQVGYHILLLVSVQFKRFQQKKYLISVGKLKEKDVGGRCSLIIKSEVRSSLL